MKNMFFVIQFLGFLGFQATAQENFPTVYFLGGNICPTKEWKLVFHDEFDGNEVNTDKWYTYFPYGPNNSDQCEYCRTHDGSLSQQIFLDENLVVDNGTLKIVVKEEQATWFNAFRNYTSGNINSKQAFTTYSKYEIRCKIPYGMGFWPAFWVFGWSTEIDVFEFGGHKPNEPHTTIWKYLSNGERLRTSRSYTGEDYSQDFHNFAVEYDPFFIKFLIDGDEKYRFSRYFTLNGYPVLSCNIPPGTYLQQPAYPRHGDHVQVIAGVGVSVDDGAFTDAPNQNTVLPNHMEVDYIRVYQRDPQEYLSDLCDYKIEGELSICGYEEFYYSLNLKEEGVDDIIWTASNNLALNIINNNEITITAQTDNEENAWITAEINGIGSYCPNTTFTLNLQINPSVSEFDIIELIPACYAPSHQPSKYVTSPLTNVTWEIDYGIVAPANSNTTSVQPAIADWFTLTATSNSICGESYTVSKSFFAEHCFEQFGMLTISPNPSDNLINIHIEHTFKTNDPIEVIIIDQNFQIKYLNNTDVKSLQIDISNFSPGVYSVFVQRNGKTKSASFVVVHQ